MSKKQDAAPLTFTREELALIANALNEVCNGLNWTDEQLQTRLGYTRNQAAALATGFAPGSSGSRRSLAVESALAETASRGPKASASPSARHLLGSSCGLEPN